MFKKNYSLPYILLLTPLFTLIIYYILLPYYYHHCTKHSPPLSSPLGYYRKSKVGAWMHCIIICILIHSFLFLLVSLPRPNCTWSVSNLLLHVSKRYVDINSRRVPLDFHFATVSPCVLWKRAEQKVSVLFLRQTGPKCPYLLELVLATLFHVNKQW